MEQKREQKLARLDQRNKERETNFETQRQNKDSSKFQNVQNFDHQFETIREQILELLKQCDDDGDNALLASTTSTDNEKFDEIGSLLQKLQKLTAEFATSLSSYDMRRSQKLLQDLQVEFLNCQNKRQPKKRFAFTSRKKDGLIKGADFDGFISRSNNFPPVNDITDKDGSDNFDGGKPTTKEATFNAKSAKSTVFHFGSECTGSDVVLADLVECFVKITGCPSTLYVNKLENCTLLCYPVSTSVFVENCRNVEFVLACQQLRVHTSTDCRFYLHVTSKAIVEDCSGLSFAPYSVKSSSKDEEMRTFFNAANLDYTRNNWDSVEDFNWPVKNAPSPNWTIIAETDRKTFLI